MKAQATPGPWVSIGAGVFTADGIDPCREIIYPAHNTRSAPPEEREANARLIAAAPEMRDALRICLEALKVIAKPHPYDRAAMARARAALAKLD